MGAHSFSSLFAVGWPSAATGRVARPAGLESRPAGYPDEVLRVTNIDDEMLAKAGLRLGTVTVDETVNVALRLAAGLPAEGRGEEPASGPFRLAEDVLAESAREQC